MRILTVRQPWAWAIIHGGKDVENRSRNLAGKYRGPVAIHVAQAEDVNAFSLSACGEALNAAADRAGSPDWWDNHGHIIGVIDLVDVHGVVETAGRLHCESVAAPTDPAACGACSRWAEQDAYHLVFANPRALAEPIPYRGALGLRNVPFEVIGDVLAERVNEHTCGTGIGGYYGTHEPGCGLEPVGRLEAITHG